MKKFKESNYDSFEPINPDALNRHDLFSVIHWIEKMLHDDDAPYLKKCFNCAKIHIDSFPCSIDVTITKSEVLPFYL